jgi:hypothetical protein
VPVALVEDTVSGASTPDQDWREFLENAAQAKELAAPATLAKPGQLVYIS